MGNDITAHMLVRDDDRFIWYAISSVLPYVSKLIIFDTGSEDNTIKIIKSFRNSKIIFRECGQTDSLGLVNLRKEQINLTASDWLWIVDGDEIYSKKTAEKIVHACKRYNKSKLGIIVPRYDLIGDIYHYQDENIGAYNQFGKIGHFVLRLLNKNNIPGLSIAGIYPNEFFTFSDGNTVKSAGKDKFFFMDERIFHAIYLTRSTRGNNMKYVLNRTNYKIEIGKKIPENEMPEVFFTEKPDFVPKVTDVMDTKYRIIANILTPVKKIKRFVIKPVY